MLDFGNAEKVKERLSVNELFGNHHIWLAVSADTHSPSVDLHRMKESADFGLAVLALSVKPELVNMETDELDLSFQIKAKAYHLRSPFLGPSIGSLFQLGDVKATIVELDCDVAMHSAAEIELEFAIKQTLFPRIERDYDVVTWLFLPARSMKPSI